MIRSLFLTGAAVLMLGAAPAHRHRSTPRWPGRRPKLTAWRPASRRTDGDRPAALDRFARQGGPDHLHLDTGVAPWGPPRNNDLKSGGSWSFPCALGRPITAGPTAQTYHLLQRVELDARTVGTPPKDHYNRTRPPIGDDRPVCVKRQDWMKTNASYPSGHAMVGWA